MRADPRRYGILDAATLLPQRGRQGWPGRLVVGLAVLVACLLVLHQWVPNTVGRLGSLLETFLPWLGVTVPVLLAAAWCRRSTVAVLAALPGCGPVGSPVARIDQVLSRSVQITEIWALPATGSDHLPVAARVRF